MPNLVDVHQTMWICIVDKHTNTFSTLYIKIKPCLLHLSKNYPVFRLPKFEPSYSYCLVVNQSTLTKKLAQKSYGNHILQVFVTSCKTSFLSGVQGRNNLNPSFPDGLTINQVN